MPISAPNWPEIENVLGQSCLHGLMYVAWANGNRLDPAGYRTGRLDVSFCSFFSRLKRCAVSQPKHPLHQTRLRRFHHHHLRFPASGRRIDNEPIDRQMTNTGYPFSTFSVLPSRPGRSCRMLEGYPWRKLRPLRKVSGLYGPGGARVHQGSRLRQGLEGFEATFRSNLLPPKLTGASHRR